MPDETAVELAKPAAQLSALHVLLADPDRLKGFPIETVERMFALQKGFQQEDARRAFSAAFTRVQLEMKPVARRTTNTQTGSFYARVEDITVMLDPIILKHGFSRSLSTGECPIDGHLRFVLILRHIGGHEERHHLDAPLDYLGPKGTPNKTKLHGMASSFTYCERHLLCKVFGVQLVADDDGNAGKTGPGAEKISEDQARDLEALCMEVRGNQKIFNQIFGVESFGELHRAQFQTAINLLEAKRK